MLRPFIVKVSPVLGYFPLVKRSVPVVTINTHQCCYGTSNLELLTETNTIYYY